MLNRRERKSRSRRATASGQKSAHAARWRHLFPPYLEKLEERTLLSGVASAVSAYSQVSPIWFESLVSESPGLLSTTNGEHFVE